jgi:antitoxin ChpS
MITVNIRKQGGAAIITIPSDVLKLMNIEVGTTLALDVTEQGLLVKPVADLRRRYTLTELLNSATKKDASALKKNTQWFRDIKSKGREIP